MRRILLSFVTVLVVLVSLLGFTYSYEFNEDNVVKFSLIGPATLYLEVYDEYEEYGITCKYGNEDISDDIIIDNSSVDTSKLGDYKVKYSININDREEYVYRIVKVLDSTKPELTLKGDSNQTVLVDGTYVEFGYNSIDNFDGDITDKVLVNGSVDTSKIGEYDITYTSTDSSENSVSLVRKVKVIKPIITIENFESNIVTSSSYNVDRYSNTVIKNNFTNDGVYYEGYVKKNSDTYKIKFKNITNKEEYIFNMNKTRSNYYSGNMNLTTIPYGTYDVYVVTDTEERLHNGLSNLTRIVRSKIGDKLITFTYTDNNVRVLVEKFKYEYDFVIDPGHGGSEIGAANGVIEEKNMNLKQSLYEKCRYESMGFKVYLTRYNDTYGELLGNKNMVDLQRRAITTGYYGSVAKVAYSNHHNAVANPNARGFEFLVANDIDQEHLSVNKELYYKYLKYYNLEESRRIYSRNLDNGEILDKTNNQIYPYQNYYAMIRIPYELFNVYVTIYEPIYISNTWEFNWYWINKKVIDITEIKIETYVKYLGGTYNSDNSSCIKILN